MTGDGGAVACKNIGKSKEAKLKGGLELIEKIQSQVNWVKEFSILMILDLNIT